MRPSGTTPPLRNPSGGVAPGSIAEVGYLPLGEVEQWVLLRGASTANPALVLLHGGPGFSETHFFRRYNEPLESAFTVAYWDQRGAGKSTRGVPLSSLTVARLMADLDELVDYVVARLGCEKVVLFGHSWGSALGVLYAARFPDKVAAYVGSGQLGSWPSAEAGSYAYALDEAQRRQNAKAIAQLEAIGPPPYDADALWTERTWLQRFAGQMAPGALLKMAREYVSVPELSARDLVTALRAFRPAFAAMWPEVSQIDLARDAPVLQMPVFFLLGRRDHWVPADTSVAYLDVLQAPSKKLVWFEASGHEPFVDEAEKFNATMTEVVRSAVMRTEPAHA